jgi:hypothetical protein
MISNTINEEKWRAYFIHSKVVAGFNPKISELLKLHAVNLIKAYPNNKLLIESVIKEFKIEQRYFTQGEKYDLTKMNICLYEEYVHFIDKIFNSANNEDKNNFSNIDTIAVFRLIVDLIEILLLVWNKDKDNNELDWLKMSKYCKYKVIDIYKNINRNKNNNELARKASTPDDEINEELSELIKQVDNEKKEEKIIELPVNNEINKINNTENNNSNKNSNNINENYMNINYIPNNNSSIDSNYNNTNNSSVNNINAPNNMNNITNNFYSKMVHNLAHSNIPNLGGNFLNLRNSMPNTTPNNFIYYNNNFNYNNNNNNLPNNNINQYNNFPINTTNNVNYNIPVNKPKQDIISKKPNPFGNKKTDDKEYLDLIKTISEIKQSNGKVTTTNTKNITNTTNTTNANTNIKSPNIITQTISLNTNNITNNTIEKVNNTNMNNITNKNTSNNTVALKLPLTTNLLNNFNPLNNTGFKLPVKYRGPEYFKMMELIKKTMNSAQKDLSSNKVDKSLNQMETVLYYLTNIEN